MNKEVNIEPIETYMRKNLLSRTQFCKRCGISISTLNKILCGDGNYRLNALLKISRAIDVPFTDFFKVV